MRTNTSQQDNVRKHHPYTPLDRLTCKGERANVFGIVVFVGMYIGTTSTSESKFTLKIADSSTKSERPLTINFFDTNPDELPANACIGDLLRVHNSYLTKFDGRVQAVVNRRSNSSWVLFSAEAEITHECSGPEILTVPGVKATYGKADPITIATISILKVLRNLCSKLVLPVKPIHDQRDVPHILPSLAGLHSTTPPKNPGTQCFVKDVDSSEPLDNSISLISSIVVGKRANIFGVVVFVAMNVTTTRTNESKFTIRVIDSSIRNSRPLTLNFFDTTSKNLPTSACLGDFIRVNQVYLGSFDNRVQGAVNRRSNSSWILISGDVSLPQYGCILGLDPISAVKDTCFHSEFITEQIFKDLVILKRLKDSIVLPSASNIEEGSHVNNAESTLDSPHDTDSATIIDFPNAPISSIASILSDTSPYEVFRLRLFFVAHSHGPYTVLRCIQCHKLVESTGQCDMCPDSPPLYSEFALWLHLADGTGEILVSVVGDHGRKFLGLNPDDFAEDDLVEQLYKLKASCMDVCVLKNGLDTPLLVFATRIKTL